MAFVDLGFELHHADLGCGQLSDDANLIFGTRSDVVDLETFLSGKFKSVSAANECGASEESTYED